MLKAIVIPPEGGISAITLPIEESPRLACIQDIVGGPIEAVPLPDERFMLINEHAKLQRHLVNDSATRLVRSCGSIERSDYIAGVAVIVHVTAVN